MALQLEKEELTAPSIAPDASRERLESKLSPLVIVLGPTGAGKSQLGLELAEAFGGEIVNCDSIQLYRGFEIGAAKLPIAERRGIQHHLLDIAGPGDELTAGAYSRIAREVLFSLKQNGRLPVVVGGTGFYVRALVDGLSPAPPRDEGLRARLRKIAARRPGALHRFLRKRDPEAARRIHENDEQKLIRAIELTMLGGQPASKIQSLPRDAMQGFRVLKLGLAPERSVLYRYLNERVVWMFNNGLLSETRALLEGGYPPDAKPMQSLGYKQAVKVLIQQLPMNEAVHQCQKETRHYAKRQMTWFRSEPGVEWLGGFGWEATIRDRALSRVERFVAETPQAFVECY